MTEELSGEFHLLDKALWKELEDKTCNSSGNIYVGREFGKPGYEFRVYYKKLRK